MCSTKLFTLEYLKQVTAFTKHYPAQRNKLFYDVSWHKSLFSSHCLCCNCVIMAILINLSVTVIHVQKMLFVCFVRRIIFMSLSSTTALVLSNCAGEFQWEVLSRIQARRRRGHMCVGVPPATGINQLGTGEAVTLRPRDRSMRVGRAGGGTQRLGTAGGSHGTFLGRNNCQWLYRKGSFPWHGRGMTITDSSVACIWINETGSLAGVLSSPSRSLRSCNVLALPTFKLLYFYN